MTTAMIFGAAILLLMGLAAKLGLFRDDQAEYAVVPIPVKTSDKR